MALSDIKRNIEEQAKREASGIRESASEETKAIIEDARSRAKCMLQGAEKQTEEELKRLREESEASTELLVKNIVLSARDEALSDEVSKAKRLLAKSVRASQSYAKILKSAVKQAQEVAPQDELVITVSKEDRQKLADTESRIEVKETGGGIIIRSKNGSIEIDATVGKLIESKLETIRNALMAELFGEKHPQHAAAPAKARSAPKPAAKKAAKVKVRKPAKKRQAKRPAKARAKPAKKSARKKSKR